MSEFRADIAPLVTLDRALNDVLLEIDQRREAMTAARAALEALLRPDTHPVEVRKEIRRILAEELVIVGPLGMASPS